MRISILSFLLLALFAVLTITSSQAQETATVTQDEEVTEAAASTTTTEEEEEPPMDFDQLLQEEEAVSKNFADADADATVHDDTATATTVPEESNETVEKENEENTAAEPSEEASSATASETESTSEEKEQRMQKQSGPLVDLLGHQLYSLEMVDETHAQLVPQYTNEALKGKKVIGLYFSADWCGPCRQFTPELVQFYKKMNSRRGHNDDFEIVWVSRCRDMQSYGQYFTHMSWLALPPEEAMGERGQMLSEKYKVKGIPTLVLLDDLGNVITTDARNKIPQDKAGIGFPWRNPLVTLYTTIFPRSLRMIVKGQVDAVKGKLAQRLKGLVGLKSGR